MSSRYRDERRHKGKRRQWENEDPGEVFAPLAYREPRIQPQRDVTMVEVTCFLVKDEAHSHKIAVWDGVSMEPARYVMSDGRTERRKWQWLDRNKIEILERDVGGRKHLARIAVQKWLAETTGLVPR